MTASQVLKELRADLERMIAETRGRSAIPGYIYKTMGRIDGLECALAAVTIHQNILKQA